jgi:hypothetical protein
MDRILLAGRRRDKPPFAACELLIVSSTRQRGQPLRSRADQAIRRKWNRALWLTRQWLAEHAEDFPIPVEDVMWVERAGHSVATDGRLIRRLARSPGR